MDSLFIENIGDFIEFIVKHCEIKNEGLLKEYQEIIKQLEEKKSFYKAKLKVSLQLKTGLEKDENWFDTWRIWNHLHIDWRS